MSEMKPESEINSKIIDAAAFQIMKESYISSSSSVSTPIHDETLISKSEDSNGNIGGMSILFRDSNEKSFTIYFSTLKNYIESIRDNDRAINSQEEDLEKDEPVFVIPAESLNKTLVLEFLHKINSKLLDYYIVQQTDEVEA
jgi:hypothetical protein